LPSTVLAGQHKPKPLEVVELKLTVVKFDANSDRSNQQKDEVFQ
jgi:hypothetical protein